MTDPEFLGDVYSSEHPFGRPVPRPGDDHTGRETAGAPELENDAATDAATEAAATEAEAPAAVSPGLLMSFLTDFRSAEYELIRMKRVAELEQSRRKRTQPAAPVDEGPAAQPDYPPPVAPVGQTWAPPTPQPQAQTWAPPPATDHYPVSESDFLVAASEAEEPGRKRLTLGLPSFKNLGQSPATA